MVEHEARGPLGIASVADFSSFVTVSSFMGKDLQVKIETISAEFFHDIRAC